MCERVPIVTNPYGKTELFGCEHCKYWNSYIQSENKTIRAMDLIEEGWELKDSDTEYSNCMRADGFVVRFAPPPNKRHPNGCHLICEDFVPRKMYEPYYTSFKDYFSKYLFFWNQGRRQQPTIKTIPFVLYSNLDIIYHVRTLDFVYGNMWKSNTRFNAVMKYRCKTTPDGLPLPEWKEIDGIEVPDYPDITIKW